MRNIQTTILKNQSTKITMSNYDIISFVILIEFVTFIRKFIFCGFCDQTKGHQETMLRTHQIHQLHLTSGMGT